MSMNPNSLPPAPRRGLSPWAWVGIGCASLTVLGFGGCVALFAVGANAVKREMAKPFNQKEAVAAMKDVPLYPKAQISDEESRKGRAGLVVFGRFLPADSSAVLALETDAPNDSIFTFYDEELTKRGYQKAEMKTQAGVNAQHMYKRDHDAVMVQIQPVGGSGKSIILMRFNGLKER